MPLPHFEFNAIPPLDLFQRNYPMKEPPQHHSSRSRREREGELCILTEAVLYGLFPVVLLLTYRSIHPLYTGAISTLLAAVVFAVFVHAKSEWHQVFLWRAWPDYLRTSLFLGIGFHGLIFLGTSLTTANNAAIILLSESFFTMLILHLWGKESVKRTEIIGSFLTVLGASLVIFPGELKANRGDLILFFATTLPPIGNYYAQRVRKIVSTTSILFVRSVLSGLTLLLISLFALPLPSAHELSSGFLYLFVNGIFLLGLSKILWVEGIHRLTLSKAVGLSCCYPFFTLIFSYLLLGETPSWWQLASLPLILLGVRTLTQSKSMQPKQK